VTTVLAGPAVASLSFSHDGKHLAATWGSSIKVWEASSGRLAKTLQGASGEVTSVCFSPRAGYLAAGSEDGTVRLWEFPTGLLLWAVKEHSSSVACIGFTPDSRFLASASADSTAKIWEVPSGRLVRTLSGHTSGVTSLSFNSDGSRLVTGGSDETVKLWRVATGEPLMSLNLRKPKYEYANWVNGVCFSPNGRLIAIAAESGVIELSGPSPPSTLRVWDLSSGKILRTLNAPPHHNSVCYSPNGRFLASGGGGAKVISQKGGIALYAFGGIIHLWAPDASRLKRTLTGDFGIVEVLSFSPDSKSLASESVDAKILVWDVASGKALRKINQR
jgi:WD40 repeat protein